MYTEILPGQLERDGALFVPGLRLGSHVPSAGSAQAEDWDRFVAGWDRLTVDQYDPSTQGERRRRYGRMLARKTAGRSYELLPLAAAAFRQSAEVIPLYGGRSRHFAPIEDDTLGSPVLHSIVRWDVTIVDAADGLPQEVLLGLHMIRTIVRRSERRLPAPEGRHRDGHRYVAMHLISRGWCRGATSNVYEGRATEPSLSVTLKEPLDTIIVNDERMNHDVTALEAAAERGVRDMLLIDFDDGYR